MPYCEAADQTVLYYEDFGDGPPIVFTNAGNLTHKMWMGQVAALAPEYRTITYDIRGTGTFGEARVAVTPRKRPPMICCMLVERLKLGPATLVAHGIGTQIAMIAAGMRPDLVNALVLVSGGPWFSGEHDGVTAALRTSSSTF